MKLTERFKMGLIVKSRDGYKKAILGLLERNENASVLDLGCGDYKRLSIRVKNAVGARRYLYGIDKNVGQTVDDVLVLQGDVNDALPVGELRFDVIIASQIIEHLWNTDGFLKEIYRCLEPTGYAVISTPDLAAWANRLYLLMGKQPEPCKVSDEMYPDHEIPGHLRVFTKSELVKLLRFHGFKVEKVVTTFGNVTVKVRK